jgi:hypothetical protein
MNALKILESSANGSYSTEFKSADNLITYRLKIAGSPAAAVKAFLQDKQRETNGFFLKVNCSNWNSATVKLQAKTTADGDDFTDTGDNFTRDSLRIFRYQ